jgi:hypothetical protein
MRFFKPFSTLIVGGIIGTMWGPKLLTKIRG